MADVNVAPGSVALSSSIVLSRRVVYSRVTTKLYTRVRTACATLFYARGYNYALRCHTMVPPMARRLSQK